MFTGRRAARVAGSAPIAQAPLPSTVVPEALIVNDPADTLFLPSQRCVLAVALLMALAGCGTPGPGPAPRSGAPGSGEAAPAATPGPAAPGAAAPTRPTAPLLTPLTAEQRWLDEWFRGTPVVIALTDSNTLAVDVPLAHSFDAGSSTIKPALAAVLERVATSLRRKPGMRLSIAAPTDGAGSPAALASARAQQVRDHLVARGVVATRLAGVGTARAGAPVQLRLLTVPQAIGRLDDATLPVPAAGVKPTAAPASASKR